MFDEVESVKKSCVETVMRLLNIFCVIMVVLFTNKIAFFVVILGEIY